jgi:aryl-alcohol dehydrogenase-like predicted oxidoreductase/predicted dehydrogenase
MSNNTVNLALPRSYLIKLIRALQNDRVKKKERLLLIQTMLNSCNERIEPKEFEEPKKKKSKMNNNSVTSNITTMNTTTTNTTTVTTVLPPYQTLPSPNNSFRVVVVGCGEISRLYVNCLIGKKHLFVTSVYDVNIVAATALSVEINCLHQKKYGESAPPCQVLASLEHIETDEPTIVLNLTPPEHHFNVNHYLLSRKKIQNNLYGIWSEKPLTKTYDESKILLNLVEKLQKKMKRKVRLGCSPITYFGAAQQTLFSKIHMIGKPFIVQCNVLCGGWMDYHFRTFKWSKHRRLGIGSLRDVGIYPISLLTLLFGRATSISATSLISQKVDNSTSSSSSSSSSKNAIVDGWMVRVTFENGVMANITCSLSLSAPGASQAYSMTIRGDKGTITMDSFWNNNTNITFIPERAGCNDKESDGLVGKPTVWSPMVPPYQINHGIGHPHVCDWSIGINAMAKSMLPYLIQKNEMNEMNEMDQPTSTSCCFDGTHAAHVVEILELCEVSSSNGGSLQETTSSFSFASNVDGDNIINTTNTINNSMKNIIFGTMRLNTAENPMDLLDAVWGMGCRTFDLAHIYGKEVESLVGKWIQKRKINRKEIIIVGKGGHPFFNSKHKARLNKKDLLKDIHDTLNRLSIDYIDIYLLHRDDPVLFPNVVDIVQTMNDLVQSGQIKQWGTSNFTPYRFQLMYECAKNLNLVIPRYFSPQYSLTIPSSPVWNDTTRFTNNHRRLLIEYPLVKCIAWAPLGEGTICGGKPPNRKGSNQCWVTTENESKIRRLKLLSQRTGLSEAALAISYVLNDLGGGNMAVVGCRSVKHFLDAARASSITLSLEELNYLKGGSCC